MNVKTKFWKRENLKIRHSGDILHRYSTIWEIHEFWGGINLSEPLFLSGFGAKKSTPEKCIF